MAPPVRAKRVVARQMWAVQVTGLEETELKLTAGGNGGGLDGHDLCVRPHGPEGPHDEQKNDNLTER